MSASLRAAHERAREAREARERTEARFGPAFHRARYHFTRWGITRTGVA